MLEPPILLTFGVAQLFGLLAVVFVILASVDDNDHLVLTTSAARSFIWHPLLMSLGMIYLFGCSAVMFRVLRFAEKIVAKIVHAGLHTVVVALALAGLSLAVMYKDSLGAKHFNTLHGIFGLITVILYTIQWLVSIPAFLWPKAPDKLRAPGLAVHVCVGVAVFLSAAVTAISGFNEKSGSLLPAATTSTGEAYYKTAAFFYFFYVLVILYMVTLSKYKRPPDF